MYWILDGPEFVLWFLSCVSQFVGEHCWICWTHPLGRVCHWHLISMCIAVPYASLLRLAASADFWIGQLIQSIPRDGRLQPQGFISKKYVWPSPQHLRIWWYFNGNGILTTQCSEKSEKPLDLGSGKSWWPHWDVDVLDLGSCPKMTKLFSLVKLLIS